MSQREPGPRITIRALMITNAVIVVAFWAIPKIVPTRIGCSRCSFARRDLVSLRQAISLYRIDTGALPARLDDLLIAPANAIGWAGPYVSPEGGLPDDPWGNPYVYTPTTEGYELLSLGADGVPGGSGIAADISLPPP